MKLSIKQKVEGCTICQEFRDTQPEQPAVITLASFPMKQVGMELFEASGGALPADGRQVLRVPVLCPPFELVNLSCHQHPG